MSTSSSRAATKPKPAKLTAPAEARRNAIVDCGWGRLLFAPTFDDPMALAAATRAEAPDRRDIVFYVSDPHVLLAQAPQELFLDPSHCYRLDLAAYRKSRSGARGFIVRRLSTEKEAQEVNRIYSSRQMVTVPPEFFWSKRDSRSIICLVAEDETSGEVVGTITGIDHQRAFGDPDRGSSLWCLAVDPQATLPRIGEALVRRLAEHFRDRGAAYLDLSVMHDNTQAIRLYEKLGFSRVPIFAVKRKNPINEKLFAGPPEEEGNLTPYARIIIDEARRRGILAEVIDAEGGFFRLTLGGRTVRCRESLTELTSAVAMSICDDKAVTRRTVERAGIVTPAQMALEPADEIDTVEPFLKEHVELVVKPARGEQGRGVSVGLSSMDAVEKAVASARAISSRVLVEECAPGEDLRLVVIDFRLVAAAVRRPPSVTGDGKTTIRDLIHHQSRRRAAATSGESTIPIDEETRRTVATFGFQLDEVLKAGKNLTVRRTANLHTGGTIHDVTGEVHPRLVEAAVEVARTIDIPVVGVDFMVRSPRRPDYVFIEANERPGLANHEPQPTAERFVDLLFPLSVPTHVRRGIERNAQTCPA